jgi:hypothetical protein
MKQHPTAELQRIEYETLKWTTLMPNVTTAIVVLAIDALVAKLL